MGSEPPRHAHSRAFGVVSEVELAWAGLHQFLRPILGLLDDLPAPQAAALRAALALDAGGSAERFAVYAGTLGLIAAAAEYEPLLCVVEDAHWLDVASAEALVFAARRLDAEPVAFLFAARARSARSRTASPPSRSCRSPTGPSEALLRSADSTVAGPTVATLLGLARGNPLALTELPRSLSARQLRASAPFSLPYACPIAAGGVPVPRPRALARCPRARWCRRPRVARRAAGAAFVRGVVLGLAEAETAGLVRLEAGSVSFRHPLVRAAAYQAAATAERLAAHRALAARSRRAATATGGLASRGRRRSEPTSGSRSSWRTWPSAPPVAAAW